MRQRNDSGSDLYVNDLSLVVPADGEFEHASLVPGCTDLDAPEPSATLANPADVGGGDDAGAHIAPDPAGDTAGAEPASQPATTAGARTGQKGARR